MQPTYVLCNAVHMHAEPSTHRVWQLRSTGDKSRAHAQCRASHRLAKQAVQTDVLKVSMHLLAAQPNNPVHTTDSLVDQVTSYSTRLKNRAADVQTCDNALNI
jgi:hypothetical protein